MVETIYCCVKADSVDRKSNKTQTSKVLDPLCDEGLSVVQIMLVYIIISLSLINIGERQTLRVHGGRRTDRRSIAFDFSSRFYDRSHKLHQKGLLLLHTPGAWP
jgi:hypothetical protein